MSKHVLDRKRAGSDGDRVTHYVTIDRGASGPGKREMALQRRSDEVTDDGSRLREFLRIEREGSV